MFLKQVERIGQAALRWAGIPRCARWVVRCHVHLFENQGIGQPEKGDGLPEKRVRSAPILPVPAALAESDGGDFRGYRVLYFSGVGGIPESDFIGKGNCQPVFLSQVR